MPFTSCPQWIFMSCRDYTLQSHSEQRISLGSSNCSLPNSVLCMETGLPRRLSSLPPAPQDKKSSSGAWRGNCLLQLQVNSGKLKSSPRVATGRKASHRLPGQKYTATPQSKHLERANKLLVHLRFDPATPLPGVCSEYTPPQIQNNTETGF